jgi:serine/threonine protein kinase
MDASASGVERVRRHATDGPRGLVAADATIQLRPDQLPRPTGISPRRELRASPEAAAVLRAARPEGGLAGRTLGDFQLVRMLGSGATACVYLAEQVSLGRRVALKVLSSTRALQPEFIVRFRCEALAVARLIHPNAVQVYCVGEDAGHHFIALEYVEGQDLGEMLAARGSLPWRAALEIVRQSAGALIRAHELGIVHRDIKPANILINRHADVKLADFGLAHIEGHQAITEHGSLLGTPLYMSPEQARGKRAGCASDLYSLGCVLYHMLTGRPPFDHENAIEVMRLHVHELAAPPHLLVPGLPLPVSQLTMLLLAKNPRARWPSAQSLVTGIARVRRALDSVASGPTQPAGEVTPAAPTPRPDLLNRIREVALSREGMRELLAMEATCSCSMPRPRRAFLEATMRNYRIPRAKMQPLLEKLSFRREDVWDLQELKRSAQGKSEALRAIARLRRLEADLGRGLLQACVGHPRASDTR